MATATKRNGCAAWIVGGGHLTLLFAALVINTRTVWMWSLALVGVLSFFAWIAAVRRWQSVGGTPTSNIASAAQGYVELAGSAAPAFPLPLKDPITDEPCLWFRVQTWQATGRDKDRAWKLVKSAESARPFALRDATGACVLWRDGAEFRVPGGTTLTPDGPDFRHLVWRIREGDPLYALGWFETRGVTDADDAGRVRQRFEQILEAWKQDTAALIARFDANRDGKLDDTEWARARQTAFEEARTAPPEAMAGAAAMHHLRKPPDGRPYLIADQSPRRMETRYRWWARLNLALCIGGIALAALLFATR